MSLHIDFYKIDGIFDKIIKTHCFHSSLFRSTIVSYHEKTQWKSWIRL